MWVQVAHRQQDTGGVKSGKFWWLLMHLRILTPIKVTKPVTPEVTCHNSLKLLITGSVSFEMVCLLF